MREYSFEKLDVWKLSKDFSILIYKITEKFPIEEKFGLVIQLRRASVSISTNPADELENKKLFRFSEQLRGAVLSISNNIAEGSGSKSNKDFKLFLNYARR